MGEGAPVERNWHPLVAWEPEGLVANPRHLRMLTYAGAAALSFES